MKSAYEKAMERLEQESGPTKKLSDEQRETLAEIDRKFDAQIAEQRLHYDGKIATAASPDEYEKLNLELTTTLQSLEDKREREKQAVWDA